MPTGRTTSTSSPFVLLPSLSPATYPDLLSSFSRENSSMSRGRRGTAVSSLTGCVPGPLPFLPNASNDTDTFFLPNLGIVQLEQNPEEHHLPRLRGHGGRCFELSLPGSGAGAGRRTISSGAETDVSRTSRFPNRHFPLFSLPSRHPAS